MSQINWEALKNLRTQFISESHSLHANYWTHELLEAYDATFAARIGWKWDSVLTHLKSIGFSLSPELPILDWGTGTGIAVRKALYHFPHCATKTILFDRSPQSESFAKAKLLEEHPKTIILPWDKHDTKSYHLLLSHVLNELSAQDEKEVFSIIEKAETVIWIEPGTSTVAKKMVHFREALRSKFQIIAPCPHQQSCGLLAPGQENNWCHHFAPVPTIAFQSAYWKEFSEQMSIDLRSLPLSFLVLQKKASCKNPNTSTLLGRPKLLKGYAEALTCSAKGISTIKLLERTHKKLIKLLSKAPFLANTLID